MDSIEFYKEFYFKEIDRKHELNNAINLPILILTTIVSLNFYILNLYPNFSEMGCVKILVIIIILMSISYSVYFLLKSFSNFIKSHTYKELANIDEILKYEQALENEQKKKKDAKFLFEEYLKKELAVCTTYNFLINKMRTEDIAKSKKGIFVATICTFVLSINYIVSLL